MSLVQRVLAFAGVSGAGLVLDYAVYALLHHAGLGAGWANLISASCGVTFVFAASARRIFAAPDGFLGGLFAAYAAYQAVAVSLAALAVGGLDDALGGEYLLAKTLVLPFTFSANFLFMSWLLRERDKEAAPPSDGTALGASGAAVRPPQEPSRRA